jgi:hypothetical protein
MRARHDPELPGIVDPGKTHEVPQIGLVRVAVCALSILANQLMAAGMSASC